jgi:AcrR family transcriptional regulator
MSSKPSSAEPLSTDKKNKILEAAKSRFLHYGVSKTTMRDIAEDVGIAVSNLYLYFENKREMVLAIAQDCRAEQDLIDQKLLSDQGIPAGAILENVLLSRFKNLCIFRTESPKGSELIAYLLQEYPERVKTWQDSFENLIFTALDIGVQRGEFHFADTRHSARMVRLAIHQFFLPAHIELPITPTEDDLIALIRWLVAHFQKPDSSSLQVPLKAS